MMRVNMSINIIAMVQPSTNGEGARERPQCANYTPFRNQSISLNASYETTHDEKIPDVNIKKIFLIRVKDNNIISIFKTTSVGLVYIYP